MKCATQGCRHDAQLDDDVCSFHRARLELMRRREQRALAPTPTSEPYRPTKHVRKER
jgi:hypothetical protein